MSAQATQEKTTRTSRSHSGSPTKSQVEKDLAEANKTILEQNEMMADLLKMQAEENKSVFASASAAMHDAANSIKNATRREPDPVRVQAEKEAIKEEAAEVASGIRHGVVRFGRMFVPVTRKEAGQLTLGFGLGYVTGGRTGGQIPFTNRAL